MNQVATFHHGFHHKPVRGLDRDPDLPRSCFRRGEGPVRHFRGPGPAMAEGPLSQRPACAVDDADLVGFRTSVDHHKTLKNVYDIPFERFRQRAALMPPDPRTGAHGADSPLGVHHGQDPGHCSLPGARSARGAWLLPAPRPVPSGMDEIRRMAGSLDQYHAPPGFPGARSAEGKPGGAKRHRSAAQKCRCQRTEKGTGGTDRKPARQYETAIRPAADLANVGLRTRTGVPQSAGWTDGLC